MTADRRPTLADVAAAAGVSIALASIVVRDAPGASSQSRHRVLQAASKLDYRPDARARMLRSSRSRLLGVVFGVHHDFHADLIGGLYPAAERLGYELALSAVTPTRNEHSAVTGLLYDRCEALILLGPRAPTTELAALAARMPVVVLARSVRHRTLDVVRTADSDGMRQAVDHFVSPGPRRIAHTDGGAPPGAAERRHGYRHAMSRHRLESCTLPGGLTEHEGATAAGAVLKLEPRPTAV